MDIDRMIKEQLSDYAGIKSETKGETSAQIEHVPVAVSGISNINEECVQTVCSSVDTRLSYVRSDVSVYREKTIFDTIEEHVKIMNSDEKINFIQTVLDRIGMTDAFIDYMRRERMI